MTLAISNGLTLLLTADYAVPRLVLDPTQGLIVRCGGAGVTNRIEYTDALQGTTRATNAWLPLVTFTSSGTNHPLPSLRATNNGTRFYRAVRVP